MLNVESCILADICFSWQSQVLSSFLCFNQDSRTKYWRTWLYTMFIKFSTECGFNLGICCPYHFVQSFRHLCIQFQLKLYVLDLCKHEGGRIYQSYIFSFVLEGSMTAQIDKTWIEISPWTKVYSKEMFRLWYGKNLCSRMPCAPPFWL